MTVAEGLIEDNLRTGVLVQTGATFIVDDTTVRDTDEANSGIGGDGILANSGAQVVLSDVLLERNTGAGISAIGASTVTALGVVIRDTRATADGILGNGRGVEVLWGASLDLQRSLVEDNRQAGIAVYGEGAEATLDCVVVRSTQPGIDGTLGQGLHVNEGASVHVTDSLFDENVTTGIAVYKEGTLATIHTSEIRNTRPDDHGTSGIGITAMGAGPVIVDSCRIFGNERHGIFGRYSGAVLDVTGSVIEGTLSASGDGVFGTGIWVQDGAEAEVADSLLSRNRSIGIGVEGDGSKVRIEGAVVRETQPNEAGDFGMGLQVTLGGRLTVSDSLLAGNHSVSVLVEGEPDQREPAHRRLLHAGHRFVGG